MKRAGLPELCSKPVAVFADHRRYRKIYRGAATYAPPPRSHPETLMRFRAATTPFKEKIMNIVLTLLPLGIVAANYLVADIRQRRRNADPEPICG